MTEGERESRVVGGMGVCVCWGGDIITLNYPFRLTETVKGETHRRKRMVRWNLFKRVSRLQLVLNESRWDLVGKEPRDPSLGARGLGFETDLV